MDKAAGDDLLGLVTKNILIYMYIILNGYSIMTAWSLKYMVRITENVWHITW